MVMNGSEARVSPFDPGLINNPIETNLAPQSDALSAAPPPQPSPKSWLSRLVLPKLTLRTKAILLAIGLGTLPVLGTGAIAYLVASQSLTQDVKQEKKEDAAVLADKLNHFIFERYGDIQVLANLSILTDPKLRTLVSIKEKQATFDRYVDTYEVYDSIALYDTKGKLLIQSTKTDSPASVSDREYFQIALKTGKPYISEPLVSKVTKVPNIFFSHAVKDGTTGQVIGVIRARMPVASLDRVFKENQLKSQELHLIDDQTGKFFLASELDQVSRDANTDFPGLAQWSQGKQAATFETVDQIDQTQQIVGYTPMPKFREMPQLEWSVLVATDSAIAFQSLTNLRWVLGLGTAATALLVAAIAAAIATRATRPIREAAQTVAQLGEGDLSARLTVKGDDELAVLGTNINQMADQITQLLEDQKAETERIEIARQEARQEADKRAQEQQQQKEFLQRRALELLMEVDPVSHGDLTIRAKVTPDEVGTIADSYNAIIRSLRQIVGQVQEASQAVSETVTTSGSTVTTLAAASTQQQQAIEEAQQKIQFMVTSIQGVATRAKQAEQGVQQATQTLKAGDDAMNRTVSGISTIRETVSETAKKVKRLGEASQKISKVVNLISNFAAQTNLLALNAAIEAARAGEEGRGFAVVAEEVRSLAQQSASATAEIEQLVEEIQSQTNDVVAAMESGTEQVVNGTRLVEETRTRLSQISTVSHQISKLVREISQATTVQTQASTQVGQTMQEVASISQDTSEQANAVTTSFNQLLQVAETLQVSVAQFKVK